jgi:hypothetical protein
MLFNYLRIFLTHKFSRGPAKLKTIFYLQISAVFADDRERSQDKTEMVHPEDISIYFYYKVKEKVSVPFVKGELRGFNFLVIV